MLTSGSRIGTRPTAEICAATSNCCWAMADTPAGLASLITERILVPKIRCLIARSSNWSSSVIGFMS